MCGGLTNGPVVCCLKFSTSGRKIELIVMPDPSLVFVVDFGLVFN